MNFQTDNAGNAKKKINQTIIDEDVRLNGMVNVIGKGGVMVSQNISTKLMKFLLSVFIFTRAIEN